jgi:superfamily II DNA or RNA helicase
MFGEIIREDGQWVIACQPHVRIRLKRVFANVDKGQHERLYLSDHPQWCRELAWFLQRFPMAMADEDRAYLEARAAAHEQRERDLATMLGEGYVPQAFELALPPREYQAFAADLLLKSGSLLLADDVGLGKTIVAICTLTDPRARPALVVTLTHLPPQWTAEIQKFAPALRVHTLKRGQPYTLPDPFPDVLLVNYAKLSGWADTLAPVIKSIVFDECQELRRDKKDQRELTAKYRAAQHLSAHASFRLGLSATPIFNYGSEMFNVFGCISPGALGTKGEFEREWCAGFSVRVAQPRAFGSYLRSAGLMLRRTRRDVARELPECQRIPHFVDADLDKLAAVETTARGLAQTILSDSVEERGAKFTAAQELSYLLRQATGVAKARHVAAFVRILLETGERVVLYGWHHEVYDLWALGLMDYKPAFYTGRQSVPQKEESKRRFVAKETPLLIMSLRAGAGLDGLQNVARTVVFGELDWSPAVHDQAIGRLHRDGQAEPVVAYFLLADCGSDPVIADVLGLKRQQSEGIRDPDADIVEQLQVDPHHIRRLAEQYLAAHPQRQEVA